MVDPMRLLCDTCIYGIMINDPKTEEIAEKIRSSGKLKICGFDLIRKELRASSLKKHALTGAYSRLMNGKEYPENEKITDLAEEYYREVQESPGGTSPKRKIINDFKIIACATLYYMNVVVSEDAKTMMGPMSKKAYDNVNAGKKLRTPGFWMYSKFRETALRF